MISAAPEMFEALKSMLKAFENDDQILGEDNACWLAKEALLKATSTNNH